MGGIHCPHQRHTGSYQQIGWETQTENNCVWIICTMLGPKESQKSNSGQISPALQKAKIRWDGLCYQDHNNQTQKQFFLPSLDPFPTFPGHITRTPSQTFIWIIKKRKFKKHPPVPSPVPCQIPVYIALGEIKWVCFWLKWDQRIPIALWW